ncbi:MAG: AAA family ATPase, partial [Candidatus Caldarchaeum sp.]
MVLLSAIIGGVLGFAIGGPPGALAGGILGWLVGLQLAKPNPSPSHATPPCSAPRSLADRSKPGNGSEAPPISQRPQTPSRIQPSGDQKRALETILKAEWAREAVFVTGVAGTGKSTVLQLVKEETYKQCAIVAPTGIAALNVGGQTIHSFFSLKPTLIRPGNSEDIKVYYPNSRKRKVMESLDLLIVDEVSMVRADLLDAIDFSLRVNRNKRDQPFGGVQVALFGDPLQLEPVTTEDIRPYISDEWGGPFFFDAKTWGDAGCEVVYLRTPHRHKE